MSLFSKTRRWITAGLMCLAIAIIAVAQQQPADLIVTNAKVVTMEGQRPQATALR